MKELEAGIDFASRIESGIQSINSKRGFQPGTGIGNAKEQVEEEVSWEFKAGINRQEFMVGIQGRNSKQGFTGRNSWVPTELIPMINKPGSLKGGPPTAKGTFPHVLLARHSLSNFIVNTGTEKRFSTYASTSLGEILGISGALLVTIVASAAFLCCACGVTIVVWVYRRNRALQRPQPPQTQPAYPVEIGGNFGTNGTFSSLLVEKPPPYPGAPQHTSVIPPVYSVMPQFPNTQKRYAKGNFRGQLLTGNRSLSRVRVRETWFALRSGWGAVRDGCAPSLAPSSVREGVRLRERRLLHAEGRVVCIGAAIISV
ncbi:uncharacterized protein LOC125031337 [Penaeus chinensis]|uniref:uncharacterized protein LOC125031337 n=1 Tax=Penaeus chinensis TaxID=139456 RepID=UPI001FB79018|nr:uncharacterized protein LOC125031337 [Penaeus chinensis]